MRERQNYEQNETEAVYRRLQSQGGIGSLDRGQNGWTVRTGIPGASGNERIIEDSRNNITPLDYECAHQFGFRRDPNGARFTGGPHRASCDVPHGSSRSMADRCGATAAGREILSRRGYPLPWQSAQF